MNQAIGGQQNWTRSLFQCCGEIQGQYIYIYPLRDGLLDLASSHSNQLKANKRW